MFCFRGCSRVRAQGHNHEQSRFRSVLSLPRPQHFPSLTSAHISSVGNVPPFVTNETSQNSHPFSLRLHRINSSTFSNPSVRSLAFGVRPISSPTSLTLASPSSFTHLPLLHRLALRNARVVRYYFKGISPPTQLANPNPSFFLILLSQYVTSRSYATSKACMFRTISINLCLFPDPFDSCFQGFPNSRVLHLVAEMGHVFSMTA